MGNAENINIKKLLLKDRAEGMSVRAVCAKIGIPTASFYNYMEGNTRPDADTLRKFARAYNIRLSDLISDIPEHERSGYSIRLDENGNFKPVPFGPETENPPEKPEPRQFKIISNVNGGHGSGVCWDSHSNDYTTGPEDLTDPEAFAMRVVGDSMAPKYTDGMLVYASPAAEVVNGDYVVAQLQTAERVVKRYRRKGDTVILESINTAVEPMLLELYEIVKMAKVTHSKEK